MQKKFTLAKFGKIASIVIAMTMMFLLVFGLIPATNTYALERTKDLEASSGTVSTPVYLANGVNGIEPPKTVDAEQHYKDMRTAFYNAFNTYVAPTLILFAICMFVFAGTKLGIEMGKAEDDAKRAEVKKRMVSWIIGIVVVMLSPLLVQAIAEIAMGFASGVFM